MAANEDTLLIATEACGIPVDPSDASSHLRRQAPAFGQGTGWPIRALWTDVPRFGLEQGRKRMRSLAIALAI
jgi:hypothetical protein